MDADCEMGFDDSDVDSDLAILVAFVKDGIRSESLVVELGPREGCDVPPSPFLSLSSIHD